MVEFDNFVETGEDVRLEVNICCSAHCIYISTKGRNHVSLVLTMRHMIWSSSIIGIFKQVGTFRVSFSCA